MVLRCPVETIRGLSVKPTPPWVPLLGVMLEITHNICLQYADLRLVEDCAPAAMNFIFIMIQSTCEAAADICWF